MPNKSHRLGSYAARFCPKTHSKSKSFRLYFKICKWKVIGFPSKALFQAVQNSECSPVPVSPMEVDSSAVLVRFLLLCNGRFCYFIPLLNLFYSSFFPNPSWLTSGRTSGHQNLVSIFPGIDNCLMVTKR